MEGIKILESYFTLKTGGKNKFIKITDEKEGYMESLERKFSFVTDDVLKGRIGEYYGPIKNKYH